MNHRPFPGKGIKVLLSLIFLFKFKYFSHSMLMYFKRKPPIINLLISNIIVVHQQSL